MNNQISTVFFDIGNVLINIYPERTIQYFSECTGIQYEEIEKRFPIDSHNEYEKGNLSNKEWYLAVKESISQYCSIEETDFWEGWKLLIGREKSCVKVLKRLKNNYSVWLLSNTNPYHIQNIINDRFEFPNLVDGKIYSFEVGLRKPDAEIYKVAFSRSQNVPERCIFIDDQLENVIAAKNVGFIGIHYQCLSQLQNDLNKLGV